MLVEGHSDWVNSVAFSHGSTRLASASYDETVKVWDASSGERLQTLNVGRPLNSLSFDSTSLFLHTEIGTIAIYSSRNSSEVAIVDLECPMYLGISHNSNRTWIQHDGRNVL
ncbi:hypothetical protein BU25DRAFT_405184 [Macroventuria anomochaeta]|uniref:Uncharacterized protein n=1 Tax=Macroventuria anomochaeta TaxID=301207 RepID=A0ACB6SJ78_9PLEO|nr:uncharacterized protein BU25DRAFT_405184 [Macroventuria anomochaeta]KAF2633262.1 hypothetical protein BU25DRAFT_405184 [Macroventuria anomochaeta]